MLNKYTQIIVDDFRSHPEFDEKTQKFLVEADEQGMSFDDREAYLAKAMEASCLYSMMPVRAPNFAHEILLAAWKEIDWRAAVRLLYLVSPEAN